jgi:hypothetical protein
MPLRLSFIGIDVAIGICIMSDQDVAVRRHVANPLLQYKASLAV